MRNGNIKLVCEVFDIGTTRTTNNVIIISIVLFLINEENNLIVIKEKNSADRYQYVLNKLDTLGSDIVKMQCITTQVNSGITNLANLLLKYSFIGIILILSKLMTNPLAIINNGICMVMKKLLGMIFSGNV
jgi:hypothetical protein